MTMPRVQVIACMTYMVSVCWLLPSTTACERPYLRPAYTVEVLVDGSPLPQLHARGTTYVEAIHDAEYAIRLSNHTEQRIAVALSVDGLGTIDAKTTPPRHAAKWVIEGYQSIIVDGWQVSSQSSRRFYFTTEQDSYAAWLGRTRNIGNIEAVIFKERQPRPQPITRQKQAPSSAPGAAGESPSAARDGESARYRLSDEHAATGIGRGVDHPVRRVRLFLEPSPAASLCIRYEYRSHLERPYLQRREQTDGFDDFEFAPQP